MKPTQPRTIADQQTQLALQQQQLQRANDQLAKWSSLTADSEHYLTG